MLNKIIEAYEHLGILSTIDAKTGKVIIRGTGDTIAEVIAIMLNLPFPVEIIAP